MMAGLAGGQANPAAQQSDTAQAPAGPRMAGTYVGANGFQLEFQPTAVILDCGDAHVIRPYATENFADRFVVTVRNGTVPFALTVSPDGTLNGSGSVEVTGGVVSGTDAGGVTFAPKAARCDLGVLSLRARAGG